MKCSHSMADEGEAAAKAASPGAGLQLAGAAAEPPAVSTDLVGAPAKSLGTPDAASASAAGSNAPCSRPAPEARRGGQGGSAGAAPDEPRQRLVSGEWRARICDPVWKVRDAPLPHSRDARARAAALQDMEAAALAVGGELGLKAAQPRGGQAGHGRHCCGCIAVR